MAVKPSKRDENESLGGEEGRELKGEKWQKVTQYKRC